MYNVLIVDADPTFRGIEMLGRGFDTYEDASSAMSERFESDLDDGASGTCLGWVGVMSRKRGPSRHYFVMGDGDRYDSIFTEIERMEREWQRT